MLDLHHVVIVR